MMFLYILLYISKRCFSWSHHHRNWTSQSYQRCVPFPLMGWNFNSSFVYAILLQERSDSGSFSFFFMKSILSWNIVFCSTLNFWRVLQLLQIRGSTDHQYDMYSPLFRQPFPAGQSKIQGKRRNQWPMEN